MGRPYYTYWQGPCLHTVDDDSEDEVCDTVIHEHHASVGGRLNMCSRPLGQVGSPYT
jgi:hypothetical protein